MGQPFICIIIFAALLSACSTVRGYVAKADMSDALRACEAQITQSAAKQLNGKIPIVRLEEISAEMLALESLPSDKEVEAIRTLSRDQRFCRERMDAVAKSFWPTEAGIRKELSNKVELVTAELIRKRVTYGNANRLYQAAALEAESKLAQEKREQIERAHQSEAQAWRTIGDGIRAIAGSQTPEPSRDPCTWSGNTIDCGAQ